MSVKSNEKQHQPYLWFTCFHDVIRWFEKVHMTALNLLKLECTNVELLSRWAKWFEIMPHGFQKSIRIVRLNHT